MDLDMSVNCFGYATGRPYDCPNDSCTPEKNYCPGLIKSLLREGFRTIDCNNDCSHNETKIMAFVAPSNDFHFYRKEQSKYWTHKFRHSEPTNKDSDGKLITNPLNANRTHHGNNYKTSCGCFCVKNI